MGTKGSYSGSAAGGDLRDGLDDWLASLPGADGQAPPPSGSQPSLLSPLKPSPSSPAGRVLPTAALFRSSRGGGGRGGGGRRGGESLTRSTAASARSAGRGAAAAYAYRSGDAQTLRDLGLDYDALRANPNIFDVANQIAQKVCEDLPAGTIETAEQMEVVGRLAEWLVESDSTGTDVSLGQIAEEAVALILAEAYLVETASSLNTKDMSGAERAAFEDGIRQAAEELAAHADLSPSGPSAEEFTRAIEDGLEYLRTIHEAD
ncbi:MAG: hypothetical protein SOH99_13510 [Acidipropionibacterium acidipropionici]|jgi:hypothetical protein|uniref:hypothetical protein n=1 Tax=Acidipropionibacterium acidipropionici TaxID=1748 RepID=UPI002F35DE32